ncbi:putative cyanamide hydratase [Rosellinia necatrix]|uniref:Putative cyanamide hydratase n=1 Tax=Rosellinia necatrix TaxID=77044 RepID=A0A1W2TPJ1_ROSNE|nr:putative cyanamide hydratase [Rosellinia necatrix]
MKAAVLLSLAATAIAGCTPKYPTTTIAGIEVVDTQLVRDALSLIKNSGLNDYVVKHQIRSWLYGAQQLNNNATLKSLVDPEAQAITILLHDLGWDMSPDSAWTTKEFRFEIDSANGARSFVQNHPDGKRWSKAKVQQMWDAIALQGAYSLAAHKEPLVWGSIQGIAVDYRGAGVFGINQTIVDQVVAEFPNDDLLYGTNETFKWFCEYKPETTYDTWVEGWGTYFVEGYDATGHRQVDQFRTVF